MKVPPKAPMSPVFIPDMSTKHVEDLRRPVPSNSNSNFLPMNKTTRRAFLKTSILAAGAVNLPARSWAAVPGANEDVRIAVIGFRQQGGSHIKSLEGLRKKGVKVRIVALCDVDKDVLGKKARELADSGTTVETYGDIRKLLENANVDAVSIATPNHWHALAAIWSVQAGKDVYVEKPVSHNVSEGRRIVEAARKYKKIVQTGTQARSSEAIREAVEWVRAGNIGKIKIARGLCYKPRPSIGLVSQPQLPPASVDYDLWCGPAEKLPLWRTNLHYDWHWVWNTGNGDIGNQGIHQMDIARWFLGVDRLSPRIASIGGRLGYRDDGETPNTLAVFHHYEPAPLIFEVRGLPEKTGSKQMDRYHGVDVGNVIECEGGYVVVPSDYSKTAAYDNSGKVLKEFKGASVHHENFLKAVASRKVSDLNADILEGHLSSALCHTGNISYQLGKETRPEIIREAIKDDHAASETFGRMTEHLAANGVDLSNPTSRAALGQVLKMDGVAERFIGNRAADAMLTRQYRPPFVVPQKV
jgi:predicted dehydrogenase